MRKIIALFLLLFMLAGCSVHETQEGNTSSESKNSVTSIDLIKPNKTVKIKDQDMIHEIVAIIDEIKEQTPEKITEQSNGWILRVVIKSKLKTEEYMLCTNSCIIKNDKYLLTDEQLKKMGEIFEAYNS